MPLHVEERDCGVLMKIFKLFIFIISFSLFAASCALVLFVGRSPAAELALPLRNKTIAKNHIPLAIGVTPLPAEKSACTKLLREMKLCR